MTNGLTSKNSFSCKTWGFARVGEIFIKDGFDDQRFDIENFFYLKDMGFRKDRVDFNKGWLGIFMENAEGKGILVKEITEGSPADEAGLKTGDIITKLNNETTIDKEGFNLIKFKKTIETTGAGGVPEITVSRDDTEMVIKPKLIAKLLTNTTEPVSSLTWLNERSMTDSSQKSGKSFIDFAIQNESYKDKLGMAIQRIGEEAYVREGFQTNNKVNPFRLSIVDYLMLHPFDTPQIGQNIHDGLIDKDICTHVEFAAKLLDVGSPLKREQSDAAGSLQEQLQHVIDSLTPCVSLTKGAFHALSHEDVEFLYQNAQKVWLPDEKITPQELIRLLALSQNVDLSKLFEAVSILLNKLTLLKFEQRTDANTHQDVTQTKVSPFNLPEPIRCQNTQNNLISNDKEAKDFTGDILFIQDTNIGKIVVGGTGTSYYYADAAIIIDLGGDDKYLGQNFSQGSCLFGIGLLLDNNGDDFYSGHVLNQGVGFFGAGLLSDLKGNDVYFSGQFAQGVGLTKGVGALIDSRGNDFYFSGGKNHFHENLLMHQ